MSATVTLRELDALIEELTVDCYGEEEQLTGFLVGAQEAFQRGEPARIVGVEVQILKIDAGPDERTRLTARVRRDGPVFEVALADLEIDQANGLGLVIAA